jgi:hypothetical protein
LLSSRVEIQRTIARAYERLAEARGRARESSADLGTRFQAFRADHGGLTTAARERLAGARGRARESSAELGTRLQAFRADHGRLSIAAGERFAEARWRARERSAELRTRLQAFRAEHGRASSAAAVGLLLGLTLAGIGAAVLAEGGNADIVGVNYTSRYVTVTGPGGTQTYPVTVTTEGGQRKVVRRVVRTHVVTGPGGVSTVREAFVVPGPIQVEPGRTNTVAGPTKTVTVTGPGQTVTQVLTQTVTDVVTVVNEVTVTVTETSPSG